MTKVIIDDTKDNPKAKLISTGKNLTIGNSMLTDSIKTMTNVNNRDTTTLQLLNNQTETIIEGKNKLNEVDNIITRSNKLVRGLIRKVSTNKILLVAIIIMLGLLILLILYLKIKKRIFG